MCVLERAQSAPLLCVFSTFGASLVAQVVKKLPAMLETRIWPLSQEDPLVKRMATPSSILPWRLPWTEEPGGLQSMRSQRVGPIWMTITYLFSTLISPAYEQMSFPVFWFWGFICRGWNLQRRNRHKNYMYRSYVYILQQISKTLILQGWI